MTNSQRQARWGRCSLPLGLCICSKYLSAPNMGWDSTPSHSEQIAQGIMPRLTRLYRNLYSKPLPRNPKVPAEPVKFIERFLLLLSCVIAHQEIASNILGHINVGGGFQPADTLSGGWEVG